MEIKNTILKAEIDRWLAIDPDNNKKFDDYAALIQAGDITSTSYTFTSKQLQDFIRSFIKVKLSSQHKNKFKQLLFGEHFYELAQPVLDKILEHLKSDSAQKEIIKNQIPGDAYMVFGTQIVPISTDAIFIHAKKSRKKLFTRKDVEKMEIDFIKYKNELYGNQKKELVGSEMNLDLLNALFVPIMNQGATPTKLDKLKDDLRTFSINYNGKEVAALASIIFNSGLLHQNAKPSSFSKWLELFSKILGVKKPSCKENAVQSEIKRFTDTYYYLNS